MTEKKLSEADLMRSIMLALSADGHMVFRGNVGLFFTKDGRPVKSGLPVGFSDLFGFTNDRRPFFLEVKTETGRISAAQHAFLNSMRNRGALADVVRSVDSALWVLRKPQ
jgi:hypothetical protein